MPHEIDLDEVERIARLAHLALSDAEKALYARQLTRILDYARQVAALDTRGVSPTARAADAGALERPDAARPSLPRDAALRNAPDTMAGLFLVPRAIEEET